MKRQLFIHSKVYYFVTELIVGMALMGVEMSASRLISTYFSSSQVVWTLIIGVIMVSMAIGNYWGGKQADKKPSYVRLYLELLFAGAYIVIIPFVGRYVIAGITALFALFVKSNLVIWASLLSCIILFVPPLLFLGKVTPSLVKYAMGEKASGKVIGTLEALNTIGSIVGTFLPTFLTIPFIGTSNSFVVFGGAIALIALLYLITNLIDINMNKQEEPVEEGSEVKIKKPKVSWNKQVKTTIVMSVFTLVLAVGLIFSTNASFVFWDDSTLVKEDESIYNYLKVDKYGKKYTFSTNVIFGIQSAINEDDSLTKLYYDYLLISPYLVKENPRILILGNGTGTYATMLRNYLHVECDITAVEIDQKIIDLSYEYFHMSEDINVICDDGRNYLSRTDETYDIILVDAYSSVSAPFQMTTVEFFNMVYNHLNEDGLMMMNINMVTKEKDSMSQSLCDTASYVFKDLYKFKVPDADGMEVYALKGNKDLYAMIQAVNTDNDELKKVFGNIKNDIVKHEDTGIRLYDDTCDIEIRSYRTLDDIVNKELSYYQKIYKEQGLKALLDDLFNS